MVFEGSHLDVSVRVQVLKCDQVSSHSLHTIPNIETYILHSNFKPLQASVVVCGARVCLFCVAFTSVLLFCGSTGRKGVGIVGQLSGD